MRTDDSVTPGGTPACNCVNVKGRTKVFASPSTMTSSIPNVQMISATWCKRCVVLKKEFQDLCGMIGTTLNIVDFDDDLDESSELKQSITSLPTIMIRTAEEEPWKFFTAATVTECKDYLLQFAIATSSVDLDF